MSHKVFAAAIAIGFVVSASPDIVAKGHGGGGHSSGGHSSGGRSSARSSGGQARGGGGARTGSGGGSTSGGARAGGTSQPATAPAGTTRGGGRVIAGGAAAAGSTEPRRGSRTRDGRLVVGTAVPRTAHAQALVGPIAPTILVPQVFRPHFVGFGFGYGVRRLGFGYSAAYYGLAYDRPLLCEEMVDCYAAPVPGAIDVPPPSDVPAFSPDDAATIVLQVQPSSAQIFVDGEFVGTVDDHASGLLVAPGVHRVEFRAPAFDPVVVDVRVAPGGRITYRASLKPSA